jgi:hypothetical protein
LGDSTPVLPEDLPDGAQSLLPGIAFLTELSLSPIGASKSAFEIMNRTATALAKVAHGLIHDRQKDTFTTPRGVTRLAPFEKTESASLLTLSWWFIEGPLAQRNVGPLIDVLEKTLPEALPRRYGGYEPPQFLYEVEGRQHFESFVAEEKLIVVWYPHAPVAGVDIGVPDHVGGTRRGFRCGRLEIELDSSVLKQPGWELAIKRAWNAVSLVVQPFYGDVRTLHGHTRTRNGRYMFTPRTEHHPVTAWWWRGVPSGPVHAAVIGEPYRKLWPAFAAHAETEGGLSFMSACDWKADVNALADIGPVPADIAQPFMPPGPYGSPPTAKLEYPSTWPFSSPFDE